MQNQQQQQVWEQLGNQLVKQYYEIFDHGASRELVLPLYHPNAIINFEDHSGQGHLAIKEVLTEKLTFKKIEHLITKVDCQPTEESGVIVLVTGKLKTDDDPIHSFSQTFYVKPRDGNYFIFHDIFRLSIHNM